MGAEIGATTSTFGYDDSMRRYLNATGREEVVKLADNIAEHLTGDKEVYETPEKYFYQTLPSYGDKDRSPVFLGQISLIVFRYAQTQHPLFLKSFCHPCLFASPERDYRSFIVTFQYSVVSEATLARIRLS